MKAFHKISPWKGLEQIDPLSFPEGRILSPDRNNLDVAKAIKDSGLPLRCHLVTYPGVPGSEKFYSFSQERYFYQASGSTRWLLPKETIFDFDRNRGMCLRWTESPGETIEFIQNTGDLYYLPLGLVHRRIPTSPSRSLVFIEEKVLLKDLTAALISEFFPDLDQDVLFHDLLPGDTLNPPELRTGWEKRLERVYEFIKLKKFASEYTSED